IATSGKFVFNEPVASEAGQVDSLAVAHLRNYSNYLLAGGKHNFRSAVAIIIRGVIANFVMVAPILLYCAGLIVFLYEFSHEASFLLSEYHWVPLFRGSVFILLLVVGIGLFLAWALYRSFQPGVLSEASSRLPVIAAVYLVVLALVILVESL